MPRFSKDQRTADLLTQRAPLMHNLIQFQSAVLMAIISHYIFSDRDKYPKSRHCLIFYEGKEDDLTRGGKRKEKRRRGEKMMPKTATLGQKQKCTTHTVHHQDILNGTICINIHGFLVAKQFEKFPDGSIIFRGSERSRVEGWN